MGQVYTVPGAAAADSMAEEWSMSSWWCMGMSMPFMSMPCPASGGWARASSGAAVNLSRQERLQKK